MEATSEGQLFPASPEKIGWVRIAFTFAFYFLKQKEYSFEKAIELMLREGGDTDTNAAIVGGLLGAAVGLSNIPSQWRASVLNFRAGAGGHKRPSFLIPGEIDVLGKVEQLVENAPTDETLAIKI